jgi:hypothetical protein
MMLVEGGYLHSMKLLIEKAAQNPDPQSARVPEVEEPPATLSLIERLLRLATKRS